jgi:hypothetical protein
MLAEGNSVGDPGNYKLMHWEKKTFEEGAQTVRTLADTGERFSADSEEAAKAEGNKRAAKLGFNEEDCGVIRIDQNLPL